MDVTTDRIAKLPPEQQAIRAKCFHPSGTFFEFPKEEVEQSIPERFEKIVRMYPDRPAVKTGNRALTYNALNRVANRIARAILARLGEGPKQIVLLFEQGVPGIAAILGVLKAGKVFVPLDPSNPRARTSHIIEDSEATLVVTDNKNFSCASEVAGNLAGLLNVDEIDDDSLTENLDLLVSPDALAYILYTSGSTGQAKGVVQNHRNVLHQIKNLTNILRISAADRLTLLSSATGYSTNNILVALLNGAPLYLFNAREQTSASLAKWLFDEKITIYSSVATVYRNLVTALGGDNNLPDLRLVYVGGEPIHKTDVDTYRKHFSPRCLFINRFGTTEAGTLRYFCVDTETQITGDHVPVGHETEDVELLLVDGDDREVGFNELGEIVVRSRYLSPGYWRRPDLTAEKFKPDPHDPDKGLFYTGDMGFVLPNGCLIHKGRKDFRVKVRGFGVELAEVETVLLSHPAVQETVVVANQTESGETRLVAYFVARDQPGPTVTKLRGILSERLPDHMIPSTFVALKALPLTPSGKVDRRALPDPNELRPDLDTPFVAPGTPLEEELAQIWANKLSVDHVGIHDNFFDIGGHSLAATRVVSQVIKNFQLEIPLRSLFEAPTIAQMAVVIKEHQAKKLEEKDLDRILTALEALSEEDAQRVLSTIMQDEAS